MPENEQQRRDRLRRDHPDWFMTPVEQPPGPEPPEDYRIMYAEPAPEPAYRGDPFDEPIRVEPIPTFVFKTKTTGRHEAPKPAEPQAKAKKVVYDLQAALIERGLLYISSVNRESGAVHTIKMTPGYDPYIHTKAEVNAMLRALSDKLATNNVDVQTTGRVTKPDLCEEMYQFLNVVLENEGLMDKYQTQWAPINRQFNEEL